MPDVPSVPGSSPVITTLNALRTIEAGYGQRMMRQWDALIQAVLPNPGRSHAPKAHAQGSASRDPMGAPSTDSLRPARFIFFDDELKNFSGTSTDVPVAVAWFGLFFSIDLQGRLHLHQERSNFLCRQRRVLFVVL